VYTIASLNSATLGFFYLARSRNSTTLLATNVDSGLIYLWLILKTTLGFYITLEALCS